MTKSEEIKNMESMDRINAKADEPIVSEKEDEDDDFNICRMFRFAKGPDYALMIIGTIMTVVNGGALPVMTLLWGDMIDQFDSGDPDVITESSKNLMLTFIYFGLGVLVSGMIMVSMWSFTGQRQAIECRKQYMRSLLRQEMAWFDLTNQAELSSKFAGDTLAFQQSIGEKVSMTIYIISLCLSGIIIAFIKGWLMTLVVFVIIPIFALTSYFYIYTSQRRAVHEKKQYEKAGGRAEQAISSIKTVKMLNGEAYESMKFEECLDSSSSSNLKFGFLAGLSQGMMMLGMLSCYALAFWYGSNCIEQNHHCGVPPAYTSGQVFMVFMSLVIVGFNVSQLMPSLRKIGEGIQGGKRIFKILDRQPLITNCQTPQKVHHFKGVIRFQNVTFAYPKDKSKKILNNLNLEFNCTKNALAGESGCGKSTILQLLMRFYDPDEGRITIDGVDLKFIDLEWLRTIVGYVGQEPPLFATSIRRNLQFAKEDATDEEIYDALKKAEAYDFVQSLEEKLDTYVGFGGSHISGGQKQRIAIARALLKDPKILLLDEATSALDRKNERLIQKTLQKIAEARISITIAHRVKTIMNCQDIFIIDEGQVLEHGPFSEIHHFKGLQMEQNVNQEEVEKQKDKQLVELNKNHEQGFLSMNIDNEKKDTKKNLTKKEKEEKQREQVLQEYGGEAFSRTFSYAKDSCLGLIIGVFLALIAGVIYPCFSIFLSEMLFLLFDVKKNRDTINLYSLIFFLLGLAFFIVQTIQITIFSSIGEKITRKVRIEVFSKILKLPISWFQKPENNAGNLSARLAIDCKQMNEMTTTYIHVIIQTLSTLFAGIIISFINQWRIALVALGLIPFLILSGAIRAAFRADSSGKVQKAYQESSNLISESMMHIRTVVSFGYENIIAKDYDKMMEAPYEMALKGSLFGGFFYGLSQFFMYLVIGLIFYISSLFMRDFQEEISTTNVFTAIFAIFFAGMSAGNNASFIPDINNCKVSAGNLFKIIDQQDEEQRQVAENSMMQTSGIEGNIALSGIQFKYQTRSETLFKNFSLLIKEGDKSAFVGASGCGKSTIFQLLLRFYDPAAGKITINGIDIKDFDLHYLRNCFGVVSQEPILFNTSFRENIKYNLDVSDEEMRMAAEEALALPFIEGKEEVQAIKQEGQNEKDSSEQKDGFDRGVGIKGSHISGGQKQRVAIARAILRKPKILLLDEATSALDSVNEKKVQTCLDKIMQRKTTISIAHRMETIKNSDIIYVFEKGEIVESGTFEKLIQKKGYFYNLERGTEFV